MLFHVNLLLIGNKNPGEYMSTHVHMGVDEDQNGPWVLQEVTTER